MASVDLLQKLIAHEESARKIGSIAEADAFAGKIRTLSAESWVKRAEETKPAPLYRTPQYTQHPRSSSRRNWRDDLATEKQVRTVEKLYKMRVPATLTKGIASMLIQSFFSEEY